MTVRRLMRAARYRIEFEWNRCAHLMAAAFWSQGHQVDPDELNPLKQQQAEDGDSGMELESSGEVIVEAGKIRVGE